MLKCACNGKKCDGKCREVNLKRPRSAQYYTKENKGLCPAAYGEEKPHRNN